jgi:hypothetical protein
MHFFMFVESKINANKHTKSDCMPHHQSDISTSLFPQESTTDANEKVKNTSILLICFAVLCVIFEIIKGQSLMEVGFKYSVVLMHLDIYTLCLDICYKY